MERCELCDSIAWSVIVNVEPLFERDVEEDGEHTLKALPHVTKEANGNMLLMNEFDLQSSSLLR